MANSTVRDNAVTYQRTYNPTEMHSGTLHCGPLLRRQEACSSGYMNLVGLMLFPVLQFCLTEAPVLD